jgi:hypothetical protein
VFIWVRCRNIWLGLVVILKFFFCEQWVQVVFVVTRHGLKGLNQVLFMLLRRGLTSILVLILVLVVSFY